MAYILTRATNWKSPPQNRKMASSGRMNSVSYTPGTAPVGELRSLEGGVHRYGQRRTVSKQSKLILMRKCKRWYYRFFEFSQLVTVGLKGLSFGSELLMCFHRKDNKDTVYKEDYLNLSWIVLLIWEIIGLCRSMGVKPVIRFLLR